MNTTQTRQEAWGKVDVKGWGVQRRESSLPAGGRAIREDCLREVVTGVTKGWAGFRYSE